MTRGRARQRSAVLAARAFRWRGVAVERYATLAGATAAGAVRQVLVAGSAGAAIDFDVRYFELAPGGRTNFERHRHAHVVMALRGVGRVRLGCQWTHLRRMDACYIAPNTRHELHNDGLRPFGFLCTVDAERDQRRAVEGNASTAATRRRTRI